MNITELQLIKSITCLSQGNIYQIGRALYSYSHRAQSPKGISRYHFTPLPGQQKRSDLILTSVKVLSCCYDVGIKTDTPILSQESLQLALF